MKKQITYIILLILSFLTIVSCGDKRDRFSLEGRIRNTDAKRIYIIYRGVNNILQADTVPLSKNGYFKMSGKIDSIAVATIYLNRNQWTSVFVRKGDDVSVTADANYMDLSQARGGRLNEELSDYKRSIKTLLTEKGNINRAVIESFKNEEVGTTVSEALDPKLTNIKHALTISAENYIKKNPRSPVSTVIILDFLCREENVEKMSKVLTMLEGPAENFYLTNFLNEMSRNMQNVDIGKQAPDFTIEDVIGNKVSLSDFKGKYVLLHFWISTDPFSRIQTRYDMADIYDNYKDHKDFSLLGISADGNRTSWTEALKQDNMIWQNVCDLQGLNSEIIRSYGLIFVPKNFLIDPDGMIIAGDVDLNNLKSIIPN